MRGLDRMLPATSHAASDAFKSRPWEEKEEEDVANMERGSNQDTEGAEAKDSLSSSVQYLAVGGGGDDLWFADSFFLFLSRMDTRDRKGGGNFKDSYALC